MFFALSSINEGNFDIQFLHIFPSRNFFDDNDVGPLHNKQAIFTLTFSVSFAINIDDSDRLFHNREHTQKSQVYCPGLIFFAV
jgi:hypothetical protein